MELTPDEERRILTERAQRAQEEADRRSLEAILPRAKAGERRWLEKMIHARGGPPVKTCKCGQPVAVGIEECSVCYERGYGK